MKQVMITVLIDEAYRNSIAKLADRMIEAGMTIDQRLDAIGVITGKTENSAISSIAKLEGVARVEKQSSLKAIKY
ncbi:hypothetical protein SAMN05216386_1012 [Nitrosospira briensis]|uniref:Uncharacterized protein n=1 Tax=Nitrosospira briensis TaxID=35799 RepID=A0A1I4Z4H1_9PROT|nr:hypothetical protein [Nitrosospira briensis]SFN44879.1 hypothetical protein SAMN05216386_1012 [Nitrosospira briensis]